jgi:hypothetical protein
LTTGSFNTALGTNALAADTLGGSSTAIGVQALNTQNFTTATSALNTAVGLQAGLNLQTGTATTLVGAISGNAITTGTQNTAFGYNSGHTLTTGSYNCYIGGISIGASSTASSFEIVLGTTNTSLTGKGNSTAFIAPGATGAAFQGNNSSTWSTTSDQRVKKNIEDNTTGLAKINQIRVRNFEYRTADEITEVPSSAAIGKEGVQIGVIAQEIETVLPDLVKEESTGVKSLVPDNILWYLVNAVQELSTENTALTARVAALES